MDADEDLTELIEDAKSGALGPDAEVLAAEVEALRAVVGRVRELHVGPHRCDGHLVHDPTPCLTLRALDGEA